MSLTTHQLTKKFGDQTAVNEVSISIEPGEIVGFLGPNGAGKSTTMKMITGYIQPTSGEASIAGVSVLEDAMTVKRKVGYLPEHNPLYKDLYVKEYLLFVAGLHDLSDKKQRVAEVIERTGLTKEQHKKIHQLSKGYRQRVGLAQAIIHDPEVLILDEPTSGLDPNQLREIRQLIRDIGKNKTVLFSSHILQEVEALCDRIIIINQGNIVADSPLNEITALLQGQKVLILAMEQSINEADITKKIQNIDSIKALEDGKYQISFTGDDIRRAIFDFAKSNDNAILEMRLNDASVESVFTTLTNKA